MNREELRRQLMSCDCEKPYIFVSYSHKDETLVWQDVVELQRRGYNVWIDEKNLREVDESWKVAYEAIEDFSCVMVIFYLSRSSLVSSNCLTELEHTHSQDALAQHKGKAVGYIAVDAVEGLVSLERLEDEIYNEIRSEVGTSKEESRTKLKTLRTFVQEYLSGDDKLRVRAREGRNDDEGYFADILRNLPVETRTAASRAVETAVTPCVTEPREAVPVAKSAAAPCETEPLKKKAHSVSGDITYSLYGETYTENQSDMMLRFFAQVLKRHQEVIPSLPEQVGMNCVSHENYSTWPKESRGEILSYFRVCAFFEYENGASICVGTSYALGEKLKKMARLLEITGEESTVFSSEQVTLPVPKKHASVAGGDKRDTKESKRQRKEKNFL